MSLIAIVNLGKFEKVRPGYEREGHWRNPVLWAKWENKI